MSAPFYDPTEMTTDDIIAILDRNGEHARISNARIKRLDLRGRDLSYVRFYLCSIAFAKFDGCKMFHTEFVSTTLSHSSFVDAQASFTDFRYADVECVDFSRSYLLGSQWFGCRVDGANFDGAILSHCDFRFARGVEKAQFNGSIAKKSVNKDGHESIIPANCAPLVITGPFEISVFEKHVIVNDEPVYIEALPYHDLLEYNGLLQQTIVSDKWRSYRDKIYAIAKEYQAEVAANKIRQQGIYEEAFV
jgi:hypothetical protein